MLSSSCQVRGIQTVRAALNVQCPAQTVNLLHLMLSRHPFQLKKRGSANKNKMETCNYDFSCSEAFPSALNGWKSSDSLELIGPSWSDFSLASVFYLVYTSVSVITV